MRIFISSLITGMEAERAGAKRAVEMLGHEAIMAESFGALSASPQVACLSELRQSDLVVLILGKHYGQRQASGVSATHEEFREAQGRKPLLVFVQDGQPDKDQTELIREAGGWEKGLYRASFEDAKSLEAKVTGALHSYELANAAAPLDAVELVARAKSLMPPVTSGSGPAMLQLAVAAGPVHAVIRPAELESRSLSEAIEQRALFGPPALFDRKRGTSVGLQEDALVIAQEGRYGQGASIKLWPSGDFFIQLPVERDEGGKGFPVLIEEDIAEALNNSLLHAGWLLEHIDPTHRITHVAPLVRVLGGSMFGWRTKAEHAASPNSGNVAMLGQEQQRDFPVSLTPSHMARQALTMNLPRLLEDYLTLLRRRWRSE